VRLLGAVRPVAHRERARDRGGDRLGPQEPRQVARPDGLQRCARVLDERAPRVALELVDGIAVEIDDLGEREPGHGAERSRARWPMT
jgi:hypothetical protein